MCTKRNKVRGGGGGSFGFTVHGATSDLRVRLIRFVSVDLDNS
jgi:hypothetical protein